MNNLLKDKLKIIAEDNITIKAIETLFIERLEKEAPTIESGDDNKILGEKFRAHEQAQKILKETLKDIENYKSKPKHNISFDKSK